MEIKEKLRILSAAAKYDVSCSSSGGNRKNTQGGVGNSHAAGLCHSFSSDGRCISLLKILLTNYCIYDCAYCVNRISNDIERARFTPREVADLTMNFYRRNYIEGLFLSSSVYKNPNYTMELLVETAKILREEYKFNGYIHLKAIPGADAKLINLAGIYGDRLSVNMELPSRQSLKLLAPQKDIDQIIKPMSFISDNIKQNKIDKKIYRNAQTFVPAGQSTQLIIGATKDSDLSIMSLSQNLYDKFRMKRVYYSAYVPVSNNKNLPAIKNPPFLREHRLYQADWLLRFYGYQADELLSKDNPNLNEDYDPKCDWALRNIHLFPIEINKASLNMLLRVPGIGLKSCEKIIKARKVHSLDYYDLKKLNIVLKRAQYFITCKGKYYGNVIFREDYIKNKLILHSDISKFPNSKYQQISFF
ncbi:MAG: putative DNA modification/repair radical SAM protein [Clostridiaceae bacterium]